MKQKKDLFRVQIENVESKENSQLVDKLFIRKLCASINKNGDKKP